MKHSLFDLNPHQWQYLHLVKRIQNYFRDLLEKESRNVNYEYKCKH